MASNTVALANGTNIPLVGLGTWQVTSGDECKAAVHAALEAGYRHIDTAFFYANEAYIGDVLQQWFKSGKLKREDIFITTKLSVTHHKTDDVSVSLEESLQKLQLDYVDLFLMHFPTAMKPKEGPLSEGEFPLEPADVKLVDTWKGMERMVKEGKAKSIGVSNFNKKQLETILSDAKIKPVANQIECHLYLQQVKLGDFMKKHGITLIAYSPFGSPERPAFSCKHHGDYDFTKKLKNESSNKGTFMNEFIKRSEDPVVLENPEAKTIAVRHNKTVAQVLLRCQIQKSIPVIPKSTNVGRIQQNVQLFDFNMSDEEMEVLEAQDKNCRLLSSDIFKSHPEYPFFEEF